MSLPQRSTSRKFYDIVIITILSGFLMFSCSFSERNMSFAYAASIVLFEDVQFKGIKSTLRVEDSSTCVNLVGKLNDFYSSVDTMGVCFKLCEHLNCNGKCEQVRGKLEDLKTVGLNDLVSSITLCKEERNKPLNNTSSLRVPVNKIRRKRDVNQGEDIVVAKKYMKVAEKRQGNSVEPLQQPDTLRSRDLPSSRTQESDLMSSERSAPKKIPALQNFLGLRQLLRAAATSMSTIFQRDGGKGHIFSSNSQSKDRTSKGNHRVENYRQRISSSRTTQYTTTLSSSNTHHRRKRRRLVVNHVREQHQKQ